MSVSWKSSAARSEHTSSIDRRAPRVYNHAVNRRAGLVAAILTAVTVATAYVHAQGTKEPIWAYGFLTPPAWNDKAAPPQNPPTHNLRANEDRDDQLRLRRVDGSNASYAFADVRDGHNVIDWFPSDHPSPMPDLIATGPKKIATNSRALATASHPTG